MDATVSIIVWWLAFAGSHIVLSSIPVRTPIVGRLGQQGFLGLYSVVALATFVPLCMAYLGHRHAGALLWAPDALPGALLFARLLGAVAFAFVIASVVQPSPTGMVPDKTEGPVEPRGLTRITRHPLFMSLGLWGLAHLFVNGFATDVAFFAGFPIYAIIGSAHQDARKRETEQGKLGAFFEQTSLLPFAAIVAGRTRLVVGELPWAGLGAGLAAAVGIYLAHGYLWSA